MTKTFSVDQLKVEVHENQPALAKRAAEVVHQHLSSVLNAGQGARVILATGNSQIQFLDQLIALPQLDWSRVTLFHMDEYLGIDAQHKASFRRYMRERVESRVKPGKFHYLEGDALEPIMECERYERLLKEAPIDLCCMGVGENGHLAFNDPPVANFSDRSLVKIVKLDDACKQQQVGEGHFPSLESVPGYALTLTIPALCSARKLLCLAPEKRKARAITKALEEPVSTSCPASFLRTQKHATLLLDHDSASSLKSFV